MALADQTYGFYIPTVSLMGVGCSKEAGDQAKALGATNLLIVTDAGLAKMGVADKIKGYIEAAGLKAVIFDGAEPNPTDTNVHDGVKVYQDNKCDGIVSLGGGSSHDCGKGVGMVIGNGGNIRDFEGVNKSTKPMPPFLAINTTAATGMDALTHAVEAYVSTIATPITDACAIKAIELVAQYLSPAVANGENLEARDKMAYAEYLAGMAFNNASLGYVHSMAHQLGGFYNLPHGVCNAILLPAVSQYNLIACPQRFADIAVAMGENISGLSVNEAAEKAISAIRRLSASIGIPTGLKELNVKEADLLIMSENAKKDACQFTNPRTATLEQVIEIFKAAM